MSCGSSTSAAPGLTPPFRFTIHGIHPRPLLYGLILFARTLGRDSRLVPLKLNAPSALHLKAWAVRIAGNTMHVLLLDKGQRSVRMTLNVPATGPATVERLLAPSAAAREGETFAGQHLGDDVEWKGRRVVETTTRGAHGYPVTIRGISAALLTFHVRPGTLGARG